MPRAVLHFSVRFTVLDMVGKSVPEPWCIVGKGFSTHSAKTVVLQIQFGRTEQASGEGLEGELIW